MLQSLVLSGTVIYYLVHARRPQLAGPDVGFRQLLTLLQTPCLACVVHHHVRR